jgi:hypothetical protein
MKIVILIVCVILLFCSYRTQHMYKSEHVGISANNIGFILGTIVTALINGFAWYYIFKMMTIID